MVGVLCEFDFEIKHIKWKENKVDDALSRKVHEKHVESPITFQPDFRQQIIDHTAEDEMYVHIKDKLEQKSIENRYEGYKLEEYEILTYKNIISIPNVAYLRRFVMDEIYQTPYSGHLGYPKIIAIARK